MSFALKPLAVLAGSGVFGLGLVFAAPDQAAAGGGGGSGLRCEITQSGHGGSVVLQGVVFSDQATDGSYEFRVAKSGGGGSSDINQSGEFSVGAGGKSSVASVSLGGSGGYSATLKVRSSGHAVACTERSGGSL